ncbi:3',5'-cyclic AMP phosphodiesterase CpdA [Granulicella rosea]|uniref:3',5'-cyclic AMP phosphodiesterase CpdA n=1 Tax=Granulicella rosea TaxID=474952 RepID=A0A239CZH6_9BACT|nr:metallophosphoesterase [Granulicella rosea]SNS25625.1 3',5'-cyclic AMP phosphodiesterase CpdA [Granulicella rosea]
MIRLAHISDLHFGREDELVVAGLLAALAEAKPDAIVVSGDLTQRAKKGQFRRARAFLDAMPKAPTLVVPGNHDVSTTNLYERMAHHLRRYKRYITNDMQPFIEVGEVVVAGIDTVRVLSTKNGRINRQQTRETCERLTAAGPGKVRIVVTHHPIDVPLGDDQRTRVARADKAMAEFADCGVDLFLSGHLHTSQTVGTGARYRIAGHNALVIQAGTAVSTRTRDEANSWNLLEIAAQPNPRVTIRRMAWQQTAFAEAGVGCYEKGPDGWKPS